MHIDNALRLCPYKSDLKFWSSHLLADFPDSGWVGAILDTEDFF